MDALIIAGHTPGKIDPLLEYANVENKALIPIAGKPMIKWVADAITGSRHVERLFIVGQDESLGIDFGPKPIIFIPNQGRLMKNIFAGGERVLQDTSDRERILVCTADVPLLTTAIVDEHIAAMLQTKHDLYYTVIRRETMLARFPSSRRTYTKVRDAVLCGGELNMASWRVIETNRELWDALLESRKNVLGQVRRVGISTLILFLLRRLSITDLERRAEKILNLKARAVITPHAELGMDVDKPFQLDIARTELEQLSMNN